jgi:allantoate deiminase
LVFGGLIARESEMRPDFAQIVMRRIEALGRVSDERGRLTRTFCSPAMGRAHKLVGEWLRAAGMDVRTDAIGNLIGRYAALSPESKALGPKSRAEKDRASVGGDRKVFLLGSHLDTVRDAGKFDGPLGVLVAIACVERLRASKIRLPFAIEVVGFADEEGVRYQSTYLGSRVLAGTFDRQDLKRTDRKGVTMAEAIRKFGGNPGGLRRARLDPKRILGYAEIHIEQGPVLEQKDLAVGVVTAIAGQTRARVRFLGRAGHTGTVPMKMRRDALCAASEFVLAVEEYAKRIQGLVATVGDITALPGASNVIPGETSLSLDVRHEDDRIRKAACARLCDRARDIGQARGVAMDWKVVQDTRSVRCDLRFRKLLDGAVKRYQGESLLLPSGAGHDAAAMAGITPVAMLFVRCKRGISHHPDESVLVRDIRAAIDVMTEFLQQLCPPK